jgi:plastocyanin
MGTGTGSVLNRNIRAIEMVLVIKGGILSQRHERSEGKLKALAGILVIVGSFAGLGCSTSPNNSGEGGNPAFTPKDVQINVGDTVKWIAASGTHTVTSGTGSNDPSVGDLFDQQLAAGQTFSHVFSAAGLISYFCRPHETMGMKGTVTVAAVTAKTVQVSASGTSFNPSNVEIHAGDTVRWVASGTHTVTSGTGSSDPSAGALFDHPLSSGQSYSFVFTSPGTFHYFCVPHEQSGMKGTVTVTLVKAQTVQVNATS